MFYQRLAQEYNDEAILLNKYISKLKKNHINELESNDFKFHRRISILYDMYLDLKYMYKCLKFRGDNKFNG